MRWLNDTERPTGAASDAEGVRCETLPTRRGGWRPWLVAALLALPLSAFALDVNRASLAELEALPGIGPALAERIVAARADRPFADWPELLRRVRGIGAASAARLSAAGLTVGDAAWRPAPASATAG